MIVLLSVLAIIIAILLMLIVLIQNPKGSGLNPSFQGISNQLLGARQTADFLEKTTWYLAGALIVLSIIFNLMLPAPQVEQSGPSMIQEEVESLPMPTLPQANPLQQQQQPQNGQQQTPQTPSTSSE